jgi:hypothetical protein
VLTHSLIVLWGEFVIHAHFVFKVFFLQIRTEVLKLLLLVYKPVCPDMSGTYQGHIRESHRELP